MDAGPSKPDRLRAYKACENCRLRKIKCSGETPCRSCTSSDIADKCFVRAKAKPNRPLPAKILAQNESTAIVSPAATTAHVQPHPESSTSQPKSLSPSSPMTSSIQNDPLSAGSAPPFRFSYDSPTRSSHQPYLSPTAPYDASPSGSFSQIRSTYAPALPHDDVVHDLEQNISHRHNPLHTLENMLAMWCGNHGLPVKILLFQDESRIAKVDPPLLPTGQALIEFEDDLMRSLVAAEDLDTLELLDCPRLLNLYTRYRALPDSLTDDQTALVYASLCIARFTQLRGGVATGMKDPRTLAREDITYYHKSRASLARWGRASITSMWALYCLVIYVQINGGAGEHGEVLSLVAWQIRSLGLHQRHTAQLYPPQDLGGLLLRSYCYSETLRAIMTDLSPAIPIVDLELGAEQELRGINEGLGRAHNHAINYLRDFANQDIDVTTASYLGSAEEAWSSELDHLRAQVETGYHKVRRGWAEMRYHWLRLLLHIPRMTLSSGRAGQATIYAARSATHILNTHSEAAFMGKLDPSWPQYKRIITCGQVLVLCCARGEIQALEGVDLFARLIALLEAHVDFWPTALVAIQGYREAASRLGIHLPQGQNIPSGVDDIPVFPPFQMNDDAASWFLDLDLGTFAQDLEGQAQW